MLCIKYDDRDVFSKCIIFILFIIIVCKETVCFIALYSLYRIYCFVFELMCRSLLAILMYLYKGIQINCFIERKRRRSARKLITIIEWSLAYIS